MLMPDSLPTISLLLMYSAMGIYALAFIAFAVDLAGRGARAEARADRRAQSTQAEQTQTQTQTQTQQSGSTRSAGTTLLAAPPRPPHETTDTEPVSPQRALRAAMALTSLGVLLHLGADLARGIAAGRVPWANMWEFSMTGTLIIVGVFLLVNLRTDLRFLGTFIVGLVLVLLGIAAVRYYVPVVPLPPALQSYWLVLHVLVASLGTGFFAVSFAVSGLQLLQQRRATREQVGARNRLRFLTTLPSASTLDSLAYRINIVGFILWTFTLIAGAIWADKAWGRYWGWDTKEVWTFIIWVIYAGYLHARATLGWRGTGSAWLCIIGFSAVMFNFGIVNVFFKGLHSYSGL
jgi:cytochrome c-type biogenesis protein CcsB